METLSILISDPFFVSVCDFNPYAKWWTKYENNFHCMVFLLLLFGCQFYTYPSNTRECVCVCIIIICNLMNARAPQSISVLSFILAALLSLSLWYFWHKFSFYFNVWCVVRCSLYKNMPIPKHIISSYLNTFIIENNKHHPSGNFNA